MSRLLMLLLAVGVAVACITTNAAGDWQPGDGHKMHDPQLPDPTGAGWVVNATQNISQPSFLVLADDWKCSETGPVTDIHFWGSWKDGIEGMITGFILRIHADIPVDPPQVLYSRPLNPPLWEKSIPITEISVVPGVPEAPAGWYDPSSGIFLPVGPPIYYQYNIRLPENDWFDQFEENIYWLSITALVDGPPEIAWGWRSTLNHWNDDAVWGYEGEWLWVDMWEPPTFDQQSLDLSFVITGGLDYGDAPDPTYETLLASNGARHAILPGFYLGAGVDTEPDGQPGPNALGDDNDGNDDENGVVFTSMLIQGQAVNLDITASQSGLLDAWVDFNGDGDWADVGEQIFSSQPLSAGVNSLSFAVPASATVTSQTFARFRFSSTGGLSYSGASMDGEVEDYEVEIIKPTAVLVPSYLLLLGTPPVSQ